MDVSVLSYIETLSPIWRTVVIGDTFPHFDIDDLIHDIFSFSFVVALSIGSKYQAEITSEQIGTLLEATGNTEVEGFYPIIFANAFSSPDKIAEVIASPGAGSGGGTFWFVNRFVVAQWPTEKILLLFMCCSVLLRPRMYLPCFELTRFIFDFVFKTYQAAAVVAAAEATVMLLLKRKKKRSKKKKLTWEAVWTCLAETATEVIIRSCREIWFSLLIKTSILASTKYILEHAADFLTVYLVSLAWRRWYEVVTVLICRWASAFLSTQWHYRIEQQRNPYLRMLNSLVFLSVLVSNRSLWFTYACSSSGSQVSSSMPATLLMVILHVCSVQT